MRNPRLGRFARAFDDLELDALIECRATPIALGRDTADMDADAFQRAAEGIFLSSPQTRRILRAFLDVARSHSEFHFKDESEYENRIYQEFPWGAEHPKAICFTGLAGIGKSQLLAALAKLLTALAVPGVVGVGGMPLVGAWLLSLKDGPGLNAILQPMIQPVSTKRANAEASASEATPKSEKADSLPKLLRRARVRTWRDAVCMLLIDEFQNLSKGDKSARATSLLLQLRTVGPRLVYGANFSLVHKLMAGSPEDGRRLVAQPIEMLPDGKGSRAFRDFLSELKKIDPRVFAFDLDASVGNGADKLHEEIHYWTFGVKGHAVALFKLAYLASRRRGGTGVVRREEICSAYMSAEYSFNRREVEVLWSQVVKNACIEKELWSPFRVNDSPFWDVDEGSESTRVLEGARILDMKQAIEAFEMRTDDALIRAAMTPQDAARDSGSQVAVNARGTSGKIIRIRRRRTSEQDLLDGADVIDTL
jgi:hypothetical protein